MTFPGYIRSPQTQSDRDFSRVYYNECFALSTIVPIQNQPKAQVDHGRRFRFSVPTMTATVHGTLKREKTTPSVSVVLKVTIKQLSVSRKMNKDTERCEF
jgi:hypothetical protein